MAKNAEIRKKAKQSGVPHWKIAASLGISEFTLCRWLRMELDGEKKARILSAIDNIINNEREGK